MKSILYASILVVISVDIAQSQPKREVGQELFRFSLKDINLSVASNILPQEGVEPASITIISREQLRLSGGRTLNEAISMLVPGFFAVQDQDDVIAAFRGLAPDNNSKVLLLINGQNMNTEYFWGPPDAILNSINYDFIERIEVIRGPGSVTLGQGALLGVINIITQQADNWLDSEQNWQIGFSANGGIPTLWGAELKAAYQAEKISTFWHFHHQLFEGSLMRNEGWISEQDNQGASGGKVYDMQHRLHAGTYQSLIGRLRFEKFYLQLGYFDSQRDLYNFYRDRDRLGNRLYSTQLGHIHEFSPQLRWRNEVQYIQDHIYLTSSIFNDAPMGGTREDRYGFKSILNIDEWIPNNKMAIGVEWRYFLMGKPNFKGHNYIANVYGSYDPSTANQERSMVYERNIHVLSLMLENAFTPTPKSHLLIGTRIDQHPFWGINLSPRISHVQLWGNHWQSRFTYQMGFRGAVGLHYTGGYRQDGFLRADNYGLVEAAGIPNASNIDEVRPERMHNIEVAIQHKTNEQWQAEMVIFSNVVQNIIDVGVIYEDPSDFSMVPIGSDQPGDWNGYWYFKNTPGSFSQIGSEMRLQFYSQRWQATASHAMVRVLAATTNQRQLAEANNSMYLAVDEQGRLRHKAYPEHISRLLISYQAFRKLSLQLTNLYYFTWYSPIGTSAHGSLMSNLGIHYSPSRSIQMIIIGKNLLNQTPLYPMNSNAGGPDVSPGTPGWETRSIWGSLHIMLSPKRP